MCIFFAIKGGRKRGIIFLKNYSGDEVVEIITLIIIPR